MKITSTTMYRHTTTRENHNMSSAIISPQQAQVKTDLNAEEKSFSKEEKLLDILGEKGIFRSPTTNNTPPMRSISEQNTQINKNISTEGKINKKLLDKKKKPGYASRYHTKPEPGMRSINEQNTQINKFFPSVINFEFLGFRRTKSLKAVLGLIYNHGKCRLKVATIAKETGFSTRTVHKCLKTLSDENLIKYYTRRLKNGLNSPSTYYVTDLGRENIERGGYALIGEGMLTKARFSAKVAKSRNEKKKRPQSALAVSLDSDLPTELLGSPIIVSKDTNNRNTSNITKEGNQKIIKEKVRECPLKPIKDMIGTEIARNSRFVEYHPNDTKGCEALLNALSTENRWFNATIKTIANFKLTTSETQLLLEDFFSYKRRKYSQGLMISPYLKIKLKRNLDNIESLNFEICNFGKYWLKIYRRKLSKNQKFIKYDEYERKRADNLLAGMRKTVENMVRDVQNKMIMRQEKNKKTKVISNYYSFIEKNPEAQVHVEQYIAQNMDYQTFYRYLESCILDFEIRNELQIFIMLNGPKLRAALIEIAHNKKKDKTPIIDLNVLTPFEFVE